MKQTKWMVLATTGAVLIGLSTVSAFAEDNTKGETKTTVSFTEGSTLSLNHVPAQYNFISEVKDKTYTLVDGSITDVADKLLNNKIVVFNNNSKKNWKVSVDLNEGLTLTGSETKKEITNPSLSITTELNGTASTNGTGSDNIVFENKDNSLDNNTGTLRNPVTDVQISFEDLGGTINENSVLTGTVHYTLSAMPDA